MKKHSGFERGSGCYACRVCGKKTRSTGRGDNENVRLCVSCWDAAGLDNEHSDGYHDDTPNAHCIRCSAPRVKVTP